MFKSLFVLATVLFFLSCNNDKNTPNVSNIKVDATIHRFDKDFFDTSKPVMERMVALQKKYGLVFDFFLYKTDIDAGLATGLKPENIIPMFINDHRNLYDSVQKEFKNTSDIQKEFAQAFQYYSYYFPNKKMPKIFTIVDGFYPEEPGSYYGVDCKNDTLLISLQMFLGKNFTGYDSQIYYDYLRERFTKQYIVKNSITLLLNQQFAPISPDAALVEQMIDAGKRVYLLDKIMPSAPDHIKLGYTKSQLKDCYSQEVNIWSYFVNNDNLFSTDPSVAKEYVGENPFTKELGQDSPGNIGAFVGWQIVKKYMSNNKSLTPAQLMATDNKIIYTQAKYKP
jgi:hypothetical protein